MEMLRAEERTVQRKFILFIDPLYFWFCVTIRGSESRSKSSINMIKCLIYFFRTYQCFFSNLLQNYTDSGKQTNDTVPRARRQNRSSCTSKVTELRKYFFNSILAVFSLSKQPVFHHKGMDTKAKE